MNDKKGFAIGMVVIILFISIMMGFSFMFRMRGDVNSTVIIERGIKASYYSEAGINLASAYLKNYGICFESGLTLPQQSIDDGLFNVAMSRKSPNSLVVSILSIGTCGNVSKAIMLQAICMQSSTTTPVELGMNHGGPWNNSGSEEFHYLDHILLPEPAFASPATGGEKFLMQPVYGRELNDDELDKLNPAEIPAKIKEILDENFDVIESERQFLIANSKSQSMDNIFKNIMGKQIKLTGELAQPGLSIKSAGGANIADNSLKVMEKIDKIVIASLYARLLTDSSISVELFRECYGDAIEMYSARGNYALKSGAGTKQMQSHVLFSGLPGRQITAVDNLKKEITNLMPPTLEFLPLRPPAIEKIVIAAPAVQQANQKQLKVVQRRKNMTASRKPKTAEDKTQFIKAGMVADIEEALAGRIENDEELNESINAAAGKPGQNRDNSFNNARQQRRDRKNSGGHDEKGDSGGGHGKDNKKEGDAHKGNAGNAGGNGLNRGNGH